MTAEVIDLANHKIEAEIGSIMRKAAGTRSYVTVLDLVRALYRDRLAYNEMAEAEELDGRRYRDSDDGVISEVIERRAGLAPSDAQLHKAIAQVCEERRYHPVRRYLSALKPWDGVPRWRLIPREVLGYAPERIPLAPPINDDATSLAEIALERFAISAVARAMSPGCQVDTVLILQGKQGFKKTTFFRALAGEWHGEGSMDIHSNKAPLLLGASWIWVWDELTTIMRGREETAVKDFVTRLKDCLVKPYGRHAIQKARSSVIAGTTNSEEILTDPTGDRRYPIIPVLRRIEPRWIIARRDQLWAEALARYDAGEQWHFTDDEESRRANEAVAWRAPETWIEPIDAWIHSPDAGGLLAKHGWITVNDIAAGLGIPIERRDKAASTRIGLAMGQLGWTERRRKLGGVKIREYKPSSI